MIETGGKIAFRFDNIIVPHEISKKLLCSRDHGRRIGGLGRIMNGIIQAVIVRLGI